MSFVDSSRMRASLLALGDRIEAATQRAVDDAADVGLKSAKGTTSFKDRSGDLRRSIRKGRTVGAEPNAFVKAYSSHARWVESGTRPHTIQARGGGTLSFVVNGARVFARRVQHPGTKPTNFMKHAGELAAIGLVSGVRRAVGNVVQQFNR